MFPLGNVVLPGEMVPLHVFEPRYRRLVLDCLANEQGKPEFGVALIERGSDVGGGDDRTSVATAARIARVDPLDGGRFAVVTVGTRRLSVLEWLPDDPYPIADVEDWPDTAAADTTEHRASIEVMTAKVDALRTLALEVAKTTKAKATLKPAMPRKLSDDVAMATYQLAARAPIGPADRFRLLQAPSVGVRLETLDKALDEVEAMLRFRLA